jgi:hypothetical protein
MSDENRDSTHYEGCESEHPQCAAARLEEIKGQGDYKVKDDSDYQTIRIRKDCIPNGAALVEAYETAHEIIVCGQPPDEPEGLTEEQFAEWYETAHNCDAMGCGTLSHVIYRFPKSDESLAAQLERAQEILPVLQEIARLTNIYIGGQCCDEHDTTTWNKLCDELRKFEDDSFTKLSKSAAALSGDAGGK